MNFRVKIKDIQDKYRYRIYMAGYEKPSSGIPRNDLAEDVRASLGKADTALQQHQDISGKEDKSNKTNTINSSSTTTQYASAKGVWDAIKGFFTKPVTGIPKSDLASDVQASLGKADTALQQHQDISGKEDKSNKTVTINESSTDEQYPTAKAVNDALIERDERISDLEDAIWHGTQAEYDAIETKSDSILYIVEEAV